MPIYHLRGEGALFKEIIKRWNMKTTNSCNPHVLITERRLRKTILWRFGKWFESRPKLYWSLDNYRSTAASAYFRIITPKSASQAAISFQKELRYSVPDRMERPPCHKCTRFALRGWISIKKSLSKTLEKAQKANCSAKIKWKLKTRRSFPPHNLQKYDTYLRQCAVYKSTNIEAWQHQFPGHKNETKLQHLCDKTVTN